MAVSLTPPGSESVQMRPKVISLGAWCRPSWQIRDYFGEEDAYPYDWNITSYAALMATLAPEFELERQLRIEACSANAFGSVTDHYTGTIFQHDLPAQSLGGFANGIFLSDDGASVARLGDIRAKMAFIYRRFRETCRGGPVVFIRWLRGGHPDPEFPAAFSGELPHKLHGRLIEYCGHDAVRLVYVVSHLIGEGAQDGGHVATRTHYGANVLLYENTTRFPPAHDAWIGDPAAWRWLLAMIADDWLGLSAVPTMGEPA